MEKVIGKMAEKEYIEREAFKAEIRRLSTHYLNEWDTLGVLAATDRTPAADVREVVLCRDCKYYNDETCDRWSDGTYLKPNDFCSRAARI